MHITVHAAVIAGCFDRRASPVIRGPSVIDSVMLAYVTTGHLL